MSSIKLEIVTAERVVYSDDVDIDVPFDEVAILDKVAVGSGTQK